MKYDPIEFTLNGGNAVAHVPGSVSLQFVLRDLFGLTGTKNGCGEGECGACTVIVDNQPVDSCILPMCQLQDRIVTTIEAFQHPANKNHPLIKMMASEGGVQCGFCTPGMVMSATALLSSNPNPTRHEIKTALAGNLCRCTGYERIFKAIEKAAPEFKMPYVDNTQSYWGEIKDTDIIPVISLNSDDEIKNHFSHHKSVRFLAGGTDLMVQKANRKGLDACWIDISKCDALKGIEYSKGVLRIGALETYHNIANHSLVKKHATALSEAAIQMGSHQIRQRATIGGNLANASPAADGYPALSCLEADVVAVKNGSERKIPVIDLAVSAGKTSLEPGEIIREIQVNCSENYHSHYFKVTPRRAQCLAKTSVAIGIEFENNQISRATIAMGAVGPTTIRAKKAEELLKGHQFEDIDLNEVGQAAVEAAHPIDDFRSNVSYRSRMVYKGVIHLLKQIRN